MRLKFYPQYNQMDCGPTCLKMVTKYYKKTFSLNYLRKLCHITKEGVSLLGTSNAAKTIGFNSFVAKLTLEKLKENAILPCILHWNENHFVVLYKLKQHLFTKDWVYYIADPGHGKTKLTEEQFKKHFLGKKKQGVAMFLEPTEAFYNHKEPQTEKEVLPILQYLNPYKKELFQLFIGLLGGSFITLLFPFLTQALIDKGVYAKDLNIVYIILLAQLVLYVSSSFTQVIQNWIMLYIGSRINLTILSNFLKKLMQLPIHFFDTKLMGDFTQRIEDHERIEHFLTSQSLFTLFSLFNFSVFLFILGYYNINILLIYIILTLLAVGWIYVFLRRRKILDYEKFQRRSENQDSIFELIGGMQEIKLNNFSQYKREEWEDIQIKLFKVNSKILKLDQYQIVGFNLINNVKNILVTFVAVQQVIVGNLTLGMLLSISYIIGQMNSPINQLISFFRSLQDARISLDRLNDVQQQDNEEKIEQITFSESHKSSIEIKNLSFQYEGPNSPFVLKELNFMIPYGQTTAIVGASGSGKTTLMKLLLQFYQVQQGIILIGNENLQNFSPKSWRSYCGSVMQDGFIFSDTIERNIATGEEKIDYKKLSKAIEIANIQDFVTSLPLGLKTKIGASGVGLSGGQKQRFLIARAVYKNPDYIFFDEATSALDADNERIITNNLKDYLKGKTTVVIAHRLSTVKNADQIIVLNKGKMVEIGNHQSLTEKRGEYYHLVKNQLELG